MNQIQVRLLSSLAKVFPDEVCGEETLSGTMLQNERFSFQLAYTIPKGEGHYEKQPFTLQVESPLADYISVCRVGTVPSLLPVYPGVAEKDDNYLRTKPGVFPDPLYPVLDRQLHASMGIWHSLWVEVDAGTACVPGKYPITITLVGEENTTLAKAGFQLEVLNVRLPKQRLIYTQWFHADCIADYYKIPVFSEEHWNWIEKFMKAARRGGVNMLLTPVFTPPLDTDVGGERTTVQLVTVTRAGGNWQFGFEKLRRWIDMALENGMEYIEISHLFTQWGAAHAPKIIAQIGGEEKAVFGWETDAFGEEYRGFLKEFLPALTGFLRENGYASRCYFHVSDEPSRQHLENYRSNSRLIREYVQGFPVIDALSDYDFYREGLVPVPVPETGSAEEFYNNGVRPMWCYYCCSQGYALSNRFFSMPSARNRVTGQQLYKYEVQGFLHWGFNFYNAQYSRYQINPFQTTDAGEGFPSGDAFSVYPGDSEVVESITMRVFYEGIQDLCALQLLETKIGREAVLKLLEEQGELTFRKYPKKETEILSLREKVNRLLQES